MLCVDTPRRAATSATGRPCSATCLTAATLNSSVNRALLINVSLRRYYEAKMCLVNLGRFIAYLIVLIGSIVMALSVLLAAIKYLVFCFSTEVSEGKYKALEGTLLDDARVNIEEGLL